MRKFYALIVVCLCFVVNVCAQDRTWNGSVNQDWNNPANWTPSGVPNGSTFNAIFNSDATVNVSGSVELNRLVVTGGNRAVTVRAAASTDADITLLSANVSSPALTIDATNTLNFNALAGGFLFVMVGDNAKAAINGTVIFDGHDEDYTSMLEFAENPGQTTSFIVGNTGSVIIEEKGAPINNFIKDYLTFNAGSKLYLRSLRPIIPAAVYAPTSEIIISGVVEEGVLSDEKESVGTLTYNCSNQQNTSDERPTLGFGNRFTVLGDLNIVNTNNRTVTLVDAALPLDNQPEWLFTINGNLNIQNNSRVIAINSLNPTIPFNFHINGTVIAGGAELNFQESNSSGIGAVTINIGGNIQHTSGLFHASTTSAPSVNLVMNGTTTSQSVSSYSGIFGADNNTSNFTLNINNPAGVTLNSPLRTGKLHLTSGALNTTSTNVFTVLNTSNDAVVHPSATSFVNGPLRRAIAGTTSVVFPIGGGGQKRSLTVNPASSTPSVFEATYFNEATAGTATNSPLAGIASAYYWQLSRIGAGTDASLTISLPGAVSGAVEGDGIVVAKSTDGSTWSTARGATGNILAGTATTGNATSELLNTFGYYTFGYGVYDAVLPIKLESFTAKNNKNSALLEWKISEDSNPVSFEVMKSSDGINFGKIGIVIALNNKLSYDFSDNNLKPGNNYYRLKMLDKDGKTTFSNILSVMHGINGVRITSMAPTMVTDRSRLSISSSANGNIQLMITDMSGRIVHTQVAAINAGSQDIWIDASKLASGIFHVTGIINGQKTETIRFFKQ